MVWVIFLFAAVLATYFVSSRALTPFSQNAKREQKLKLGQVIRLEDLPAALQVNFPLEEGARSAGITESRTEGVYEKIVSFYSDKTPEENYETHRNYLKANGWRLAAMPPQPTSSASKIAFQLRGAKEAHRVAVRIFYDAPHGAIVQIHYAKEGI